MEPRFDREWAIVAPVTSAPRSPRAELDALAAHHRLGRPAVEALFVLADARPTAEETLHFARRLLGVAGVVSLVAALVFFLAANWEALGRFARFGLVAVPLVGAVGVALWRPPPARAGKVGLDVAFVLTGALLALFGQTYQTGADVHELFFGWAALGLPLVIAARCPFGWAAWVLVLDVAFALLCGWLPGTHVLWLLLDRSGFTAPLLFVLPLATNFAIWVAVEAAAGTRLGDVAAPWLGRFALAAGFGIATWGAVLVILPIEPWHQHGGRGWILLLAGAMAAGAVATRTLSRQRDVFPMAILAGSVLALGTAILLRGVDRHDPMGTFLLVTGWLVGGSGVASWVLMGLLRQWREEGTLA
jgi:uncharacterized membrane protein